MITERDKPQLAIAIPIFIAIAIAFGHKLDRKMLTLVQGGKDA